MLRVNLARSVKLATDAPADNKAKVAAEAPPRATNSVSSDVQACRVSGKSERDQNAKAPMAIASKMPTIIDAVSHSDIRKL